MLPYNSAMTDDLPQCVQRSLPPLRHNSDAADPRAALPTGLRAEREFALVPDTTIDDESREPSLIARFSLATLIIVAGASITLAIMVLYQLN